MELPNYHGKSIVNLMSSIEYTFGGKPMYPQLQLLPQKMLKNKTVILIIIDALGYEYLLKNKSFLHKGLKGKITSVFPATTAAGVTTFITGDAPQQHALTGWFMYLKEINLVSTIIPFVSRVDEKPLKDLGIEMSDILMLKPFSNKINVDSIYVTKKSLICSEYTKLMKMTQNIGCKNIEDFFLKIAQTSNLSDKKRFVLAYWPDFDSICHKYGVDSIEAKDHFNKIVSGVELLTKLKSKESVLIITADHGQINVEPQKLIKLDDHQKLKECLILPLCGEPRATYCYVHSSKTEEFEKYVKTKMRKYCYLYKSEDILKKNFFGFFKENKKLKYRIGNYTLIMKKNYILKDFITKNEEKIIHIGNHGGTSKEEMYVPLIIFN